MHAYAFNRCYYNTTRSGWNVWILLCKSIMFVCDVSSPRSTILSSVPLPYSSIMLTVSFYCITMLPIPESPSQTVMKKLKLGFISKKKKSQVTTIEMGKDFIIGGKAISILYTMFIYVFYMYNANYSSICCKEVHTRTNLMMQRCMLLQSRSILVMKFHNTSALRMIHAHAQRTHPLAQNTHRLSHM